MSQLVINDLVQELSDDNKRLLNLLVIERQFIEVLDQMRNKSLVLINKCKCDTNEELIQTIHQLNRRYRKLKDKSRQLEVLEDTDEDEITIVAAIDHNNTTVFDDRRKWMATEEVSKQLPKRTIKPKPKAKLVFKCRDESCGQRFTSQALLARHIVGHYRHKQVPESGPQVVTESHISGQSLTNRIRQAIRPRVEPTATTSCVNSAGGKPRRGQWNTPHVCPYVQCGGKRFKLKTYLNEHIRAVHASAHTEVCGFPGCGRRLATRKRLAQHMYNSHRNRDPLAPITCPYEECAGVQYVNTGSLNEHIRSYHSPASGSGGGQRRVVTETVAHQPNNNRNNNGFQGVGPNGERVYVLSPHVCPHDWCGQRFLNDRTLSEHIREVHSGESYSGQDLPPDHSQLNGDYNELNSDLADVGVKQEVCEEKVDFNYFTDLLRDMAAQNGPGGGAATN